MDFEYKTVGGPERGRKRKGCRTASERVAAAMEELIQTEAAQGWEYLRTDLVPVEERAGLFARRQTMHCAVLVFRRPRGSGSDRAALSRKAQAIFAGRGTKRGSQPAEPRVGPAPAAPTLAMPAAPAAGAYPAGRPAAPTPEQLAATTIAAKPYSMDTDAGQTGSGAGEGSAGQIPPAPPPGPAAAVDRGEPRDPPSGLFTRNPRSGS